MNEKTEADITALTPADLRARAHERLRDAKVLLRWRRYDGAVYICGYAVEYALKACVCETLNFDKFPSRGKDFQGVRTHDLVTLLRFSGQHARIMGDPIVSSLWSDVAKWNPEEFRYKNSPEQPPIKREEAVRIVWSTRKFIRVI